MTTKVCTLCRELKPLKEFWRDKTKVDGRSCQCKPCRSLQMKQHRQDNPDIYRKKHLRHLFGLTIDAYKSLLTSQNSVCAICGNINHNEEWLSVDHDHNTQEIRGLLCSCCNSVIGYAHDNPKTLRKAANYLEGKIIA